MEELLVSNAEPEVSPKLRDEKQLTLLVALLHAMFKQVDVNDRRAARVARVHGLHASRSGCSAPPTPTPTAAAAAAARAAAPAAPAAPAAYPRLARGRADAGLCRSPSSCARRPRGAVP